MNYNYTLKYRSFDSLLEDVKTDLRSISTEGNIEPAQLIKVAMRVNYDLGLRIYKTKEKMLCVEDGRVRLPDDFYVMNYALVCGEYEYSVQLPQGTNIQEVVPEYRPWIDQLNCTDEINMGELTCLQKCGNNYGIIQVINTEHRFFKTLMPVRFKNSEYIDCDCPNLRTHGLDEAYIKDGFIWTSFKDANLYINYQGSLEDDNGNLLVPDHPFLNEYYEYALKKRILENAVMDGANVVPQLQLVMQEYRGARNNALSVVNTPNFSEMQKLWAANRKAMYSKYYDMFKSYFRPIDYRINNAV
jgi:hypothetical protein